MKVPFFFASACVISCGLVNPGIAQVNSLNISSAAVGISDPSTAAKNKARPNKARAEDAGNKASDDSGEITGSPKLQAASVAQEQSSHRARSFFLFLHILRSAK